MATSRRPIRYKESLDSKSPISPKKRKSKPKDCQSSEADETDNSEFEGFDEIDRINIDDSPSNIYPNLPEKEESFTPRSWRSESSFKYSPSPLRRDLNVSPKFRRNQNSRELASPSDYIWIVFYIFFTILSVAAFYYSFSSQIPERAKRDKNLTEIHEDVIVGLKSIRSILEQTREVWIQIISQVRFLVEESVLRPSVILVVVPKNSEKTAACLIDRLSDLVSEAFQDDYVVVFDVESGYHSTKLKEEMDNTLKNLKSSHTAVVYNIEKLPGSAAMLLHRYCDDENAPFKRSLFFLTMGVEDNFNEISLRQLDEKINDLLLSLWQKQVRDVDAGSIITRIANAPIVIKPESSSAVKSLCNL